MKFGCNQPSSFRGEVVSNCGKRFYYKSKIKIIFFFFFGGGGGGGGEGEG